MFGVASFTRTTRAVGHAETSSLEAEPSWAAPGAADGILGAGASRRSIRNPPTRAPARRSGPLESGRAER
jgi:hypothetical protein